MLFNSFNYFLFLFITFFLFRAVSPNKRITLLLICSYFFYSCWDPRFLLLIVYTTVVDYTLGKIVAKNNSIYFVWLSVLSNFSVLFFFKYYNFFVDSFNTLFFNSFASDSPIPYLNILLPVGISFYTFQSFSYVYDSYKSEVEPKYDFAQYALYVSFFPQLVAGPIEKARTLLPQFSDLSNNKISPKLRIGFFLILVGLFEKIVLADNFAKYADSIFLNLEHCTLLLKTLGTYSFAMQIFCDFSAYTNIARGTALLFGIKLTRNFKGPYFSATPSEFWNRWHISLSGWLKTYLYIPLGGNRNGSLITKRNLLITMLLGGLWHGASFNFLLWGLFHGVILIVYKQFKIYKSPSKFISFIQIILFFHLICISWIFFRITSFDDFLIFISLSENNTFTIPRFGLFIFLFILFLIMHYLSYTKKFTFLRFKLYQRIIIVLFMLSLLLLIGVRSSYEFLYFQF